MFLQRRVVRRDGKGAPGRVQQSYCRSSTTATSPTRAVIFDRLSKQGLCGIVEIQLRGLAKLLVHRRVDFEVSDVAKDHLVELGYEPAFGARPLKRVILKSFHDSLAEAMLKGGYGVGDKIMIDFDGRAFTFAKA